MALKDVATRVHSLGAIFQRCKRLGLEVVKQQKPRKKSLTSSLELPKELPSVEEALKILAGAIKRRWELLLVSENCRRKQQLCLWQVRLESSSPQKIQETTDYYF